MILKHLVCLNYCQEKLVCNYRFRFDKFKFRQENNYYQISQITFKSYQSNVLKIIYKQESLDKLELMEYKGMEDY